jgi:hypothetical protein
VRSYTEHHTREVKLYCAVVLDTYSRRVIGWSIDSSPTAALVTNGTAEGSVDSDPVRPLPRWKDQHRAQAVPDRVPP